ncbi:MAG: carboxypeptidase-like regulatory domain-containing protein [Pseudomonadota bacterium]|nr:carboxypeptidase-like regulatory domain-containing protein [Pseudomonadota bacterium]
MILLLSPGLLPMALLPGAMAATLSGTVFDANGAPVPSVDVVAYDARLNYASARTTTDGGFLLGSVPPGRYRLRAMPPDGDPRVDRFLPDTWDFCAADVVEVGTAAIIGDLDFALPEGGSLTGRLLATDGAPVVGAQVLALGQSERSSLVSRLASTDADGVFTVVGLDSDPGESEPYAAYVAAGGYPRQYLAPTYDEESAALFDILLGEREDAEDQPLLDGITVTGTVSGPDGPVASGTVFVYSPSQVLSVAIDSAGTYVADGLPPGDVTAWASSDGLATTYYPDADRPGERVSVPEEGQMASGVDLALGAPSSLSITLTGSGDLSEASVLLYNDTMTVGRGGSLDEAGLLTIEALHPGTYFLAVYGADVGLTDDYLRDDAGEPLAILVDGDTALTVDMPAGASFSGTVRGDDGEPIYGAYVYASATGGENTEVGVTDADGVYTIRGLPGADYTLRASYAHYCPSDAGWVTVYWPDHLAETDATITTLAAAEGRTGVDFVLFADDDHDAMGDSWEEDNGLDPHRDDAGEDADGDGYVNVDEWRLGTDPTEEPLTALDGCGRGCGSGGAALVLLLPLAMRRRQAAWTGKPRSRALRW